LKISVNQREKICENLREKEEDFTQMNADRRSKKISANQREKNLRKSVKKRRRFHADGRR